MKKTKDAFLDAVEVKPISKRDPWLVGGKSADQARLRYTLGAVYVPNETDAHGDTISEEQLQASAWAALGTEVGLMHEPGTQGAGKVVESYIHRGKPFTMKDVTGKEQEIPTGAWMMGVVWSEEAWKLILDGRITGYSLQGRARSEPVAEPEEKRKGAGSLFTNIVFGVQPASRDFDVAELERTEEETFSPASAADRQEQERVGRALTDMAQETEPLRNQPRVSFANLFSRRER